MCFGVDSHQDIDVTAAGGINGAANINAADEDGIGILCQGNISGNDRIFAFAAVNGGMDIIGSIGTGVRINFKSLLKDDTDL